MFGYKPDYGDGLSHSEDRSTCADVARVLSAPTTERFSGFRRELFASHFTIRPACWDPDRLSSRREIAIEAQTQPRGEFLARAPQACLERVSRDAQDLRSLFRGKPFNFPQPECCAAGAERFPRVSC